MKKTAAPDVLRHSKKLGYQDSNLEMLESESSALPFGDSPICNEQMVLYTIISILTSPNFYFFVFYFSRFAIAVCSCHKSGRDKAGHGPALPAVHAGPGLCPDADCIPA
jgi:hypothetical protein